MNTDGQSGRLNGQPGKVFLLFMISALMLGAFAPDMNAGPNDVSAAIAVKKGDHNLTIPPIPDGAEVSHITVMITAAPGWTIVQLDPAPSGWSGTYHRMYDGLSPGAAYSALFSGIVKPVGGGETGGGRPGQEPDYTFRVDHSI